MLIVQGLGVHELFSRPAKMFARLKSSIFQEALKVVDATFDTKAHLFVSKGAGPSQSHSV